MTGKSESWVDPDNTVHIHVFDVQGHPPTPIVPMVLVGAPPEIPFAVPRSWHDHLEDDVPLVRGDGTAYTADDAARFHWHSTTPKSWSEHRLDRCRCDECRKTRSALWEMGWRPDEDDGFPF